MNLEDDDDIRILLDRAYSSTSSILSGTASRPVTSGGRRSGKTRPGYSHPYGPSQSMAESPPARRGSATPSRGKAIVRRPQTAGTRGRMWSSEGRKISPSGAVQLRREMLLHSHGEGRNAHLFPAEQFKTTAMGRKECVVDPGRKAEVRNAGGTAAIRACVHGLESLCKHEMQWLNYCLCR